MPERKGPWTTQTFESKAHWQINRRMGGASRPDAVASNSDTPTAGRLPGARAARQSVSL